MQSPLEPSYDKLSKREYFIEILSSVLLALATVGSSWSAYQSTRWSGVQDIHFGEASATRSASVRNSGAVNRKIAIDVGLFVQFASALSQNNEELVEFLLKRFPPRLRIATDAWLRTKPLQNPDAPKSPFEMPEYHIEELRKEAELTKQAEENFHKAKEANQTGDNYVLLTVLFASVLFFAGVGMKFHSYYVKLSMLLLATCIFIAATAILSRFPIH